MSQSVEEPRTRERLEQLQQDFAETGRGLVRDLVEGSLRQSDLKGRPGDCRVLRVFPAGSDSVIVKMWNRPGVRGFARRFSRTAPHQREIASLERLWCEGVPVPAPLGSERLRVPGFAYTDALILEDLGECELALDHIKRLVEEGKDKELDGFLAAVVELTARMVEARVVDADHSFLNIVAQPSGEPARLDLEIATRGRDPQAYVVMLAKLVSTLAFALQPDVSRVAPFAAALRERLTPGDAILAAARARVMRTLGYQRTHGGPDTHLDLPWPR